MTARMQWYWQTWSDGTVTAAKLHTPIPQSSHGVRIPMNTAKLFIKRMKRP